MNKYLFSIILSLTFLWGCQPTPEISQWRGPGRTGVYNETNLLKQWPEEGPEMLWALDSLPKGNSSVSIYNDVIYLTGLADTMDVLIAVDMNGNLKWTKPYGRAWNASFSESRCTPTIDDGMIFLSSGLGDVACMETGTGELIWQVKASEKFEGTYGKWGISESPLLYGNNVMFTPGGSKTTMVALDKNTGETVWMSESLDDEPAYVSPLLVHRGEMDIIVSVTKNFIFGVDAKNGDLLWKFNYGEYSSAEGRNIQTNTPLYFDGNIFVTNGYDHKSVLLKLAEDASSVTLQYVDTILDIHHGGAVRLGNYIYGANWEHNRMGRWVCLDWATGNVTYETEWYNKGSIISAEGMLYCYDEKTGYVGLVKANPEKFEVVSEFEITRGTGPHWSHPVIKNGILYIRHTDALMAFNIKAN